MSATYELFARWKDAKGFTTDADAARALRVHVSTITPWKLHGRNGSAAVIERMAKDLGEDPVPVILQAFAEAARDADDKRTLAKLARRVGAACVALLALVPLMLHSSPAEAAGSREGSQDQTGIYIMRKWLLAAVRALLVRLASGIAPRLQPHDMEPISCNHPASCPAGR